MSYENADYWRELHGRFNGTLKAVGWPGLSEAYNEAKYVSETHSFLEAMKSLPRQSKAPMCILEIGVGIGFWTAVLYKWLSGFEFSLTGLDISEDALATVRARFPEVDLAQVDLRTVNRDHFLHRFDLVTALMVLLHLTVPTEFDNALRFAARSVRPGGTLLLYEPALIEPYSPWLTEKLAGGNSVARSLKAYDHPLEEEGLKRVAILSGASWLLNSPIEAGTERQFRLRQAVWYALCQCAFRFERLSSFLSPLVLRLDALLKRGGSGSGKFLVYRRLEHSL
jgi:SAM-dependent methyltransferase